MRKLQLWYAEPMREESLPKKSEPTSAGSGGGNGGEKDTAAETQALARARALAARIGAGTVVSKAEAESCKQSLRKNVSSRSAAYLEANQLEDTLYNYVSGQRKRLWDLADGIRETGSALRAVRRQTGEDFAKRERWVERSGHQEHVDALNASMRKLESLRKFEETDANKYIGEAREYLAMVQQILDEVAKRQGEKDSEKKGDVSNFDQMPEADFKRHVAGLQPDQMDAIAEQVSDPGRKQFVTGFAAHMRKKISETADKPLSELGTRERSLKIASMGDEQLTALLRSPEGKSLQMDIKSELARRGSDGNANEPALTKNDSDALFAAYQGRGITTRQVPIITRSERDAAPLACNGESFLGQGSLENWVDLQ